MEERLAWARRDGMEFTLKCAGLGSVPVPGRLLSARQHVLLIPGARAWVFFSGPLRGLGVFGGGDVPASAPLAPSHAPSPTNALFPGDRLISVNGENIGGKSYAGVVELIQRSPPALRLRVVPEEDDIIQKVCFFLFCPFSMLLVGCLVVLTSGR